MSIYKKALQSKLRISSKRGMLTVEDLFQLPLSNGEVNLVDLARGVYDKLGQTSTNVPDFLSGIAVKKSKEAEQLQLTFDVLKDVIETRQKEIQEMADTQKRQQEKSMIQELIAKKEHANLENLSVEELKAKLAEIQ